MSRDQEIQIENLRGKVEAVETVRDNLAHAMRLGGDAGHVIDGRWILRRLVDALGVPVAVDPISPEDGKGATDE